MKVECLHCLKSFSRPRGEVNKYNHNFCCKEHYIHYRRLHPEEFNYSVSHERDFSPLMKLRKSANDKLLSNP
jgi:hypothetical protein